MSYAVDPTQPLPKRWKDSIGPIRLLMTAPVEGWLLARRPGAAAFAITVRDLLSGNFEPILPKSTVNVRKLVESLK